MSRYTTPCALTTIQSSSTLHRWKITALAAAVAAFGLYTGEASALALGKITVKSALGEPLRAEIEVPQITAAEADTLQVKTAAAAIFRGQGMDYTGTAGGVQARVQRRANGTAVIVLTSARPVNDPFVDYVLDANWNTGQVVRSYTMLFDPPSMKKAEAAITAAPQISDTAPAPVRAPAPPVRVIEEPLTNADASAATPARTSSKAATRTNAPAPVANSSADGASVRVQRGDTAGRIAATHKPADVSLDQMLVAMVQANPKAFIGGNVNHMRTGASINMPSAEQARAVSPRKARQMVAAQSRDFNEYRRQLAGHVTTAQVVADNRAVTGKVDAAVTDKKATAPTPDQLKLDKSADVKGKKTAEASVATAQQANANQERSSELNKNIEQLKELSNAANKTTTDTSAAAPKPAETKPAAAAPGIAVTAAAPAPAITPPAPVAPAPTPEVTPTPAPAPVVATPVAAEPAPAPVEPPAPAPAPVEPPPAPKPAPVPPPAPIEEPSFIDGLLDNPLTLPVGGGLLALLLGGLGYSAAKRRKAKSADAQDSVMESNLSQDSFFGASGGQHIDTSVSAMTTGASSLAYTPSQLDAGDVDPVAEADVYLAYGRDLQAEEILKEALRTTPGRTALHAKLAEIYAKRKDRLALESIAKEARQISGANGPDWLRIVALGQDLDAANPLYQSNTAAVPAAESLSPAAIAAAAEAARSQPIAFEHTQPAASQISAAPQSDFGPVSGLDFAMSSQLTDAPDMPDFKLPSAPAVAPAVASMGAAATAAVASVAAAVAAPVVAPAAPAVPAATMADFDRQLAEALSIPSDLNPSHETLPGTLDFQMSDLDPDSTAQLPLEKSTHSMDFDLTSLSLDLPTSDQPERTHPAPLTDNVSGLELDDSDPLATKLTLAQEFLAIGDKEGARSLAQEVLAESTSSTIKAQAQRLVEQSV